MQDLKQLLTRLLANQIDFVLVGGFAGVIHGSTLVTQDLDICAAISPDSIVRLQTALRDLNPKHRMNPNFKPSFLVQPIDPTITENIYLETDLGILDIMSTLPPVGDFEMINKGALVVSLYGFRCRVISLDDLIRIKETMSRPKDLQALAELKVIRQKKNI